MPARAGRLRPALDRIGGRRMGLFISSAWMLLVRGRLFVCFFFFLTGLRCEGIVFTSSSGSLI
jgi:hypothetical protein